MLSCPPKCRPTGAAALTIEWPSRDAISAWSYTNGLRRYSKRYGRPPRRQVGVPMSAKHQQSIKGLLPRRATQRFGNVPEHDG